MSLLQHTALAGPYREANAERLNTLKAEAQALQFSVAHWALTGEVETDLCKLGQLLGFPNHFGANFDALYDCLSDPSVLTAAGSLLIIEQPQNWDEEIRDTLIAVLQAAADEAREQGRAQWSLFDAARLDLDPLPKP